MPKIEAGGDGYFLLNEVPRQRGLYEPVLNADRTRLGIRRTSTSERESDMIVSMLLPNEWVNGLDIPYSSVDDILNDLTVFFFRNVVSSNDNSLLETRVTALENAQIQITHFQVIDISQSTTGAVNFPSQSTLNENALASVFNAILFTLDGSGNPDFETPINDNDNPVSANLSSNGVWVATETFPNPVAIAYIVNTTKIDYNNWTQPEKDGVIDLVSIDNINPFERVFLRNQPIMNQGTSFEPYLSVSIDIPRGGNYIVNIAGMTSINSTGVDFQSRLIVNNDLSNPYFSQIQEYKDSGGLGINAEVMSGGVLTGAVVNTGTGQRVPINAMIYLEGLSEGVNVFTFEWAGSLPNQEATIYDILFKIKEHIIN